MEFLQDEIVPISKAREKFFGTSGRMVCPCPATVAALLNGLPQGKVITFDRLRQRLAEQAHVEAACPVTTQKALKAIAQAETPGAPYWRVVKKNGEMMSFLPGGATSQAERLAQEGFPLDRTGRIPKIKPLETSRV